MTDLDDTLILKQLAVDRAADTVLWLDRDGRLRYVNDTACDELGYSRDELLAMSIFDIDETLNRDSWPAHWQQIKSLERSTMETHYRTRTGGRFPVEATVNFIAHSGREYQSIFARGISEQKEAEDALIAITARLEALIENLPVGILFEDDQRKVVLANQTLCQMLDIPIPPGSLAGNDSRTLLDQCKDLFPVPEQFLSRVEMILDARLLVKNEELGLNDGRVFARDYVPIQTKKHHAHLWQFRDVTERKRAEAELLKAKLEAEKANAAKSSFLAMMSHELRTPLNAVLGMTELSLETELTREQREFLRTIQGNSENLLGLIDDVLDLSRIEANRMDIDHIPYDPRALVEEVAGSLNVRAAAKDVELVVDIDPHLPSRILGDPKRVRQVLVNLIGNAVKFTEKGYILVSAELEDWKPGDRLDLALSVRDTGVGIPEEKQKELFSKFYQADRSTTRRFGGSGLGLNISRSLTELMGGRIDFTSVHGEGSTFRVTLATRAPQDTEPNSATHRARFSERRARALLSVSTEPLSRSLHRTLKAWGFEVDTADSLADLEARLDSLGGETALSIIEHFPERVDLDVLKRLRKPPGRELVLLTSLAASSSSILAEIAPHVVVKPVRQTKLAEAVAIALGLRARPTAEPHVTVPPESSERLAGYRILLVEDNQDNQLLAARVLESAGARVEKAANGAEGVSLAEQRLYDLIVMDLMMPVMDGFQATQAIREAEDAVNRTPIVALTAHATEGFRKKCLESGMDGYLSKPFKKERLLALAEQWVDRRPLLLVVDDAPENRFIVKRFLAESDSYRMIFASNGREALELFESYVISLVLLDMEMPVFDGFETARALRGLERSESTPILAITAHAEPQALKRCVQAGCTAVLQKPLARQELNAAVARHLGPSEPLRSPLAFVAEATGGGAHDDVGQGYGDRRSDSDTAAGDGVVVVDPDILDLVPRFIEAQRSNTGRILELARAGEFETVRRLGHNMKGTGKGYGFEIISSFGASLENAAQRSAETDIERIVTELGDYLSSVRWQARR